MTTKTDAFVVLFTTNKYCLPLPSCGEDCLWYRDHAQSSKRFAMGEDDTKRSRSHFEMRWP